MEASSVPSAVSAAQQLLDARGVGRGDLFGAGEAAGERGGERLTAARLDTGHAADFAAAWANGLAFLRATHAAAGLGKAV